MTSTAKLTPEARIDAHRQDKADALRRVVKTVLAPQAGLDATTVYGLRSLARSVEAQMGDTDLWAGVAAKAGVRPPGASYVPGRSRRGDRYATLRRLAADLHAEADALAVAALG